MAKRAEILGLAVVVVGLLSACTTLRSNMQLLPVREYERMIVGRLDAEYVGTDNCVAKCHAHEKITSDFRRSVHGEQIRPDTKMPLVNCESCHGPGSLALVGLSDDVQENDRQKRKCDTKTFLDLDKLPAPAKSLICLKCHAEASLPVLSHWNASPHALNNVACTDCHRLHQGPTQKVSREEMAEMCYGCHPDIRAKNQLPSHHAMRERKIVCADCHDVHGSRQDNLLKGLTTKETCTRCHMDKQGPFVFEHGDVTENCSNCHQPHGSVNRPMLNASMPFICLQCHPGHRSTTLSTYNGLPQETKKLMGNRCSDCHSQVHGTNVPTPVRSTTDGTWSGKGLQ